MYLLYVSCVLLTLNFTYSASYPECEKSECPDYQVIEKKENYEIRKYPAYKGALVETKGKNFIHARKSNFFKLYRYQQGNNDKHHSFPMVYPFVNIFAVKTWTSGEEVKEEVVKDEFGMAFFIPKDLHESPPQGLSEKDNVVNIDIPEKTAYVVSFPGFANPDTISKLQKKLHDDLTADGVDFDHGKFYVTEYNKINQLWGRHNDIGYAA